MDDNNSNSLNASASQLEALAEVASIPRDDNGPVFSQPWQAEAFAMTLTLHAKGLFEWSEWAQCLAEEIKRAQSGGDPDLGDTYYHHWLAALEAIVVAKGVTSKSQLKQQYVEWDEAAKRTPHGAPIQL